MDQRDERDAISYFAFLHAYRSRLRGWQAPPKKYPSMPRSQWRVLAAICFAVGAVIGALAVGGDSGRVVIAAVVGGLLGIAVGMWTIETLWLRRRRST